MSLLGRIKDAIFGHEELPKNEPYDIITDTDEITDFLEYLTDPHRQCEGEEWCADCDGYHLPGEHNA